MFIILGADGKEYGPVDESVIKNWIQLRRADLQTRARRDGETEWKTLRDFPEFSDVVAPPPTIPTAPALPAPGIDLKTPVPVDAKAYAQEIINRGVKIDIAGCINRSWEFCKKDYWPILGATVVSMLCHIAISMIPYIGGIISALASGIFYGGLYYYYLGKIRGEQRELKDVFEGFSRMTSQLMLAPIVQGLIIFATMIPGFVLLGVGVVFINTLLPLSIALFVLAGVAIIIPVWYLSTSWSFSMYLIIDKRFAFWESMEISRLVITKQWWRMFGLMLLTGLMVFGGMLLCYVGCFFVMPIVIGAFVYAYGDIFCDKPVAITAITPAKGN